jgi:ornithine decarboxylase
MKIIMSLGVDASRIIYAHPCKPIAHLKYAAANGVRMLTFDNVDELYKIKKYHPTAQPVLRIRTDDSRSFCQLGLKFGASMCSVKLLLQKAKELELDMLGIRYALRLFVWSRTYFS